MKIADLEINWPKTIALTVLTALLFWGYSCQPQVASLVNPGVKITRPELQIELDAIIATAEYRLTELNKQQAFQDIIFKNAMLMAETGTMNPVGILTLLAGLYGIARGTKDLKDKVQKKNSS
ncbi:unnamed protein product [marine sediment metagenome]|uniref:Uncharacterized protein n=1 Tax=marine sediment metagenome TaxID=412755 RepID=X1IIZ5_9ZZZZ